MNLLYRLSVWLRARRLRRHQRFMRSIKGMYVARPNPAFDETDYRDYLGAFRRTPH